MHSGRLLEEEEEKLKQLMHLKEEQERYIERAQQEKQELQQEMALQSRSLQQAQQQLEEVRQNRQRADEDVEVRFRRGTRRRSGNQYVIAPTSRPVFKLALSSAGCVIAYKLPNNCLKSLIRERKQCILCVAFSMQMPNLMQLVCQYAINLGRIPPRPTPKHFLELECP